MSSLTEALLQLEGSTLPRTPNEPSHEPSMTTRYTDEEWSRFFVEVESGIEIQESARACPEVGSVAFNKTIDHTLLKPEAKASHIDDLCSEARVGAFATVCVRPHFVAIAASDLKGSDVKIASVVGFPEGTYDLYQKMQDVKTSLVSGAHELDIVLNYPALQRGDYSNIYNELATLRLQAAHPTVLKLIFETSQLDNSQIVAACTLAAAANFDFVKTSTGFKGAGATIEHVRLLAACCDKLGEVRGDGKKMKVKASGGIRTLSDAVAMLGAGASRLGTSAGVLISQEAQQTKPERDGIDGQESANRERQSSKTRVSKDY